MWDTLFEPPHVLAPKHAKVFRVAAASLFESLGLDKADEPLETEVEVFDNLTPGQKLASILNAATALLDPSVDPPKVTAVLAATVYVVYMELQALIETEIALGDSTSTRQLLLNAMEEANHWAVLNDAIPIGEDPVLPIGRDCTETDEWPS